jgi:hypothetical protein
MNSKIISIPSLQEAAEELRSLLPHPKYSPQLTSEEVAREQAFYAGQLWTVEKLELMALKYEKGD